MSTNPLVSCSALTISITTVVVLLSLALAPMQSAAQSVEKPATESGTKAPTQAGAKTGPSGLPLPRFVSLKSDRINVRAGPGQDHKINWIFSKAGLPVEIIAEYDNWRRIRDSEGDEGWVFHSLLSGRRTALVAPWSDNKTIAMRRGSSRDSGVAARLEPGVLVDLGECNGAWCQVRVKSISGWMPQTLLWGVYPKEKVK